MGYLIVNNHKFVRLMMLKFDLSSILNKTLDSQLLIL